ncbi:Mbov_0396 family ICE element transmembrane protein [Spiroplasma endosymbiont of Aspidapion aeneum]|uniref:Mbov_0396 family ICE element transmembrane protein n=1 Tax=Spiroplasma endosymbiont of Aspidapion aeneum TaxID=3066276 RepID=UPI00313F29DE
MEDILYKLFLKTIWFVFIQGPLQVCGYLSTIINYINSQLIKDILKDNNKSLLTIFSIFAYASICLLSIIFIINFISMTLQDEINLREKIIQSLKNSLFGVFIIVFIPQIIMFLIMIMNFSFSFVNTLFTFKTSNLADILYYIGDKNFDYQNVHNVSSYSCPNNITDYNFFIEFIAIIVCVYSLLKVSITITGKIIEIIILYLISPFVAILSVIDNKRRLIEWRNILIENAFEGVIFVLTMDIFCMLLNSIISTNISLGIIERQIFIFIFILAGSIFVLQSQKILHILVNSYNHQETHAGFLSAINIPAKFTNSIGTSLSKLTKVVGFGNGIGSVSYDKKTQQYKSNFQPTGVLKFGSSIVNAGIKTKNGLSNIGHLIINKPNINTNKAINKFKAKVSTPYHALKNVFTYNDKPKINKEDLMNWKNKIVQKSEYIESLTKQGIVSNKVKREQKKLDRLNKIYNNSLNIFNKKNDSEVG